MSTPRKTKHCFKTCGLCNSKQFCKAKKTRSKTKKTRAKKAKRAPRVKKVVDQTADITLAGIGKPMPVQQLWGIYPVAIPGINKLAVDNTADELTSCTPIVDATLNQTHLTFLKDLLHLCQKHKVDFYSDGLVKFREDNVSGDGSYGPASSLVIEDLASSDLPIGIDAIIVSRAGVRTGLNFK
jgi:hypothetical protein